MALIDRYYATQRANRKNTPWIILETTAKMLNNEILPGNQRRASGSISVAVGYLPLFFFVYVILRLALLFLPFLLGHG